MASFSLIVSMKQEEDNGIPGAEASIDLIAKNKKEAIEKARKILVDFSYSDLRNRAYSILNHEKIEEQLLTVTITISELSEFAWFTIYFETENNEHVDYADVDELVGDWVSEFFDANDLEVKAIACETL